MLRLKKEAAFPPPLLSPGTVEGGYQIMRNKTESVIETSSNLWPIKLSYIYFILGLKTSAFLNMHSSAKGQKGQTKSSQRVISQIVHC